MNERQVQEIADKAAQKAVDAVFERLYREIGKGIVKRLFWSLIIFGLLWVAGKGWLKP